MDRIQLLHGDCMELMANTPDKFYDLAIVDPPYGLGYDGAKESTSSHGGRKAYDFKDWDSCIPEETYFTELFRVSKNQIIWGANYMTKYLPASMGWIFWDKGQRICNSDGELAFTSFERALRVVEANRVKIAENGGAIHPTQKPVYLYRWVMDNYSTPDMHILDTHLGSGSSAIAAHYFGCKFTGIEIDKDYYDAAVKRFNLVTSQQQLF